MQRWTSIDDVDDDDVDGDDESDTERECEAVTERTPMKRMRAVGGCFPAGVNGGRSGDVVGGSCSREESGLVKAYSSIMDESRWSPSPDRH